MAKRGSAPSQLGIIMDLTSFFTIKRGPVVIIYVTGKAREVLSFEGRAALGIGPAGLSLGFLVSFP